MGRRIDSSFVNRDGRSKLRGILRRTRVEALVVGGTILIIAALAACQVTPILTEVEQRVKAQQQAATQTVATPVFAPTAGTYSSDQQVTITDSTPGATIYYTTDGSTPTTHSSKYSSPVPVAGDGTKRTIQSVAVASGMTDSGIARATFVINYSQVSTPVLSPSPGPYTSDQQVTITDTTPGAIIHYTMDGTTPTSSSPTYNNTIPVAGDGTIMTISAIGTKKGFIDSTPASGTYTIQYPHTVTFDAQGGSTPNPTSISVKYHQQYGTLATTTRTGYSFDGWWTGTGGSGSEIFSNSTVDITADQTLYAKWLPAGSTWTQRTLPSSQTWQSVAYGNGVFVAVASNSNVVATSPDGVNWTPHALPSSQDWYSVTYGNGIFVATVGYQGGVVATSPDGVTWTQHTVPVSQSWVSVTYGNGIFVSVSFGSNVALTSPDGVTWTWQDLPSSQGWHSVTYGNGVFVAVASSSDVVATSPDGVTWTSHTLPSSQTWLSVTYGNGVFVAVPQDSDAVATSPDGVTWTAHTLPSTYGWSSVTYGNGIFVTLSGNVGSGEVLAISPDGVTWTPHTLPGLQVWESVAYGNGVFVAVTNSNVSVTSP